MDLWEVGHVKWDPCHGMAHPQVVDGDCLQMWRVAVNVLNKQLRTNDEVVLQLMGLGGG
jgi:hypothetical protein